MQPRIVHEHCILRLDDRADDGNVTEVVYDENGMEVFRTREPGRALLEAKRRLKVAEAEKANREVAAIETTIAAPAAQ